MPLLRLTSTIAGHQNGALCWLRRFFGILLMRKKPAAKGGHRDNKSKSQLSNAEYHLTMRQMQKIIESGGSFRDRVLLQMLAETGMRRAEIANQDIEDIRFTDRLLFIRRGKGGKSRLIPITDSLCENLIQLLGGDKIGPVFRSKTGRRLGLRQVNRIVAAAGRHAGVNNPNPRYQNINPHLFRHSFARIWKDKRGSIETLSKILGHQSVDVTWSLYGSESLADVCRNYKQIIRKF
jgi:integrase